MIDKDLLKIFSLPANELHVWDVSLLLPEEILESLSSILDENEKSKAAGFKFENDKRKYIAAHGALRQILAGYLNCEPRTTVFNHNRYGKPFIKENRNRIEFNLTHSKERALIAVTRDKRVGVDLEYRRSEMDFKGIAQQYFSAPENQALQSLPANSRNKAFFDCWTRKEAFIKATGKGFSQSLKKFDVSVEPGKPARLLSVNSSGVEAAGWQMFDLVISPDYSAAVIVEADQVELKLLNWKRIHQTSGK